MVQKTETSWTCDLCMDENVTLTGAWFVQTGTTLVDNIGVSIHAKPVGQYRNHVCQDCAELAVISLADRIERERRARAYAHDNKPVAA